MGFRLRDLGAFLVITVFLEGLLLKFANLFFPNVSFFIFQSVSSFIPLFVLWLVVLRQPNSSLGFDWRLISVRSTIKYIIGGYLLISAVMLLSLIVVMYGGGIPGFGVQESYTNIFGTDVTSIIALFIFGVIIAPVTEEVIFRGYVQRVLVSRTSKYIGISLTATVFALIHSQPEVMFSLFGIGWILGYLYERCKSLPTVIFIHSFNNLIALVFTILILPILGFD